MHYVLRSYVLCDFCSILILAKSRVTDTSLFVGITRAYKPLSMLFQKHLKSHETHFSLKVKNLFV